MQIILPGEGGWEHWRAEAGPEAGSAPTFVRRFDGGAGVAYEGGGGAAEYGIAAEEITVVPLWIQVPEQETEAAVTMQLEGRGIRAAQAGAGWQSHRIARREGGRRLAVISVLGGGNSALAAGSRVPDTLRAACDYLPFRSDRVTLYRELGRLVVAVTQGAEVVYVTPLVAREAVDEAAREIVQIVFQLKFEEVVGRVSGLDVWLEGADVGALAGRTGLDVAVVGRPAPVVSGNPAPGLVTPDIAVRREAARRGACVRKAAMAAGVALSALVISGVVAGSVLGWKRDALLEEMAALSPRAAAVAEDKGRWMELSPALERDGFALEILRRLSEVPSVRGVSLTKFEMVPGAVTVAGRAAQPGLALKFGGEVTGGTFLPEYRWEFPAPAIANDNTATFELRGVRKGSDETES